MCGIAGVRRFAGEPITGEELVLLLCSLEHRGNHATGLALVNPDGIHVHKAPEPAWNYTRSKDFKTFLDTFLTEETTTALLHTRFATVGNPQDNENNHPMFDGQTAVVHNGSITNCDFIFNNERMERSCKTDSDVIRALIDKYGFAEKSMREFSKMSGSAAIAAVTMKEPDKLLLARSGSPLVFAFSNDGDKLYWASEGQALMRATKPFREVRGVWVQDTKSNISVGSMPDNTAWVFSKDAFERHHEFKVCYNYRAPDYSKGRESYFSKTENWRKEKKRAVHLVQPTGQFTQQRAATYPSISTSESTKSLIDPKLKGASVKCPGCGKANRNPDGTPWNLLICRKCNVCLGEK